MTDHMKEAERLTDDQIKTLLNEIEYGNMVTFDDYAYLIARKIEWHVRAALLAHIQRGAVPEGERAAFESWIENEAGPGAARRWMNTEAYENSRVQDYRSGWVACLEWLAAAPAPDHFRDAAEMAPVHCTPTEHEGRIVYEHTSEPIPNADGFVLYAAKMVAAQKPLPSDVAAILADNMHLMHESGAPAPAASAFPERDTTRPAEDQGLFRKFDVRRVDGSDRPGGKHHGCEYFVLDVDHDPHAPAALLAYAQACATTHPELSADLIRRYGLQAPAPAEVPMPVADEFQLRVFHPSRPLYAEETLRNYGAACRAAGEAAGYARGLKEAGRDAKEWGNALNDAGWAFDSAYHRHMGEPTPPRLFNTAKTILRDAIIAYTAALRGEVKP